MLGLGVEAVGLRFVLQDLADDDRNLYARILGDLADRLLKRPEHDVDAGLDIFIFVAELADRRLGAQQRDTAAGNDAFLHAAFVGTFMASSTRSFFSLTSTSVERRQRE